MRNVLGSTIWLVFTTFTVLGPRAVEAQFLCSAGTRDGLTCEGDDDCSGGGVCVIPLGVCTQGESDGFPCICPGAECTETLMCIDEPSIGTCNGGVFEDLCCDTADNCFDGSPCIATQRLCVGGEFKGFPCVEDRHCEGSACRSTGGFCLGGDFDSFACADDGDCLGFDVSGICTFAQATPTPSPGPERCAGDCSGDRQVTVDEILIGVNLILQQASLSTCRVFDADESGTVTIDELLTAIQSLLAGCG